MEDIKLYKYPFYQKYMTTTLIKPTLEAEVEGLGEIYRIDRPFNKALESLREQKTKVISSRELAYARIKEGGDSSLFNYGSYTREGFLYLKNEPVLVALNSPLLDLQLAEQAFEASRKENYFLTDKKVYEQYKEQAEQDKNKILQERKVLILPKRENYEIPTNKFNENELTLFLFKDQAENYGNFLRENEISEMPVWLLDKNYVNSKEGSILTQLWLLDLGNWSVVVGYYGYFVYDCRVRGVFEKPSEAGRVFEEYVLELEQEKNKEIAELESRYKRAVNYLKTGKL